MYTLSCKDMGESECGEVVSGATPEEAISAMMAHAMAKHGEHVAMMKKTMSDDQMMDAMKKAVKSA